VIALAVILLLALAAGAVAARRIERAIVSRAPEQGPARALPHTRRLHFPNADRWMLPAGPVVALAAVAAAAVVVPLGPALVGSDLVIGVFYFIVVVDFIALAAALSGWGGNTNLSIESAYRAVAQLIAYVVPLGLAFVGVIMMAQSLSTGRIVAAQQAIPFIVLQPIGFLLYLVTGAMQAYRAPFLEPFADAIDGGALATASGWAAIAWRWALSALLLLVAAMGAILYLGGWNGPWLPGWAWMTLKTAALLGLIVWLGRRPRPRSTAEMLALSWKALIPIGMANVLVVGGMILLGIGPT
jgi:NADH-quinone oxidoreductase subunit H